MLLYTVIVNAGYYGEKNEKKTLKNITKNIKKLHRAFKKEKIKVDIGIETMGKRKVFGSLDEIIEVCSNVKNIVPVINVAHIHSRGNGSLQKHEDFEEIFEKLKKLKLKHYLIHITGALYENGSEQYHLPIKKGDMSIAPLIDVIMENNYNVTLISESPLLEHDAVYIRLQVEKAIMKRTGKEEADYRDLERKKWIKS